jgi:uncharacterized repeat protein (TIGR01451 family)
MRLFVAAMLAIAMLSTPVQAQGVDVTNEAMVEVKTIDASGQEKIKYVTADKVVPGSVILYLITYTNNGDAAAEGIVLNSAIHEDLTYIESSAETDGAVVHYSIDGGQTYANREDLVVTEADGTKRPAEASDLTNVRWTMERALAPGKKNAVSFRAQVN